MSRPIRGREVPVAPLVLYAVCAVPISLRAFVPESVPDLGLVIMATVVGWLDIWLFARSRRITTWAADPFSSKPLVTASS